MDLWAVHVKSSSGSNPFLLRTKTLIPEKPMSWNFRKMGVIAAEVFDIRVSRRGRASSRCRSSFVVKAIGKNNRGNSNSNSFSSSGNGDRSNPKGDGSKGSDSSSESNRSDDTGTQKVHHKTLDWREFRAILYERERIENAKSGGTQKQEEANSQESKPLGQKWAHPISSPENGCVLVATEKLDGNIPFERTVVLLLRSGTQHPNEGPSGAVINRPLHKKIKHMKPSNRDLATTFSDCSLHFGGPLEASMFLMRTREKSQLSGFEEVIPGLCFGARDNLDEAAALVRKGILKPQDFRFFNGYTGWLVDQLREEIEAGYWHVAACSANLIFGGSTSSSSVSLWEEILQLMGGQYSELSRKPKQDM